MSKFISFIVGMIVICIPFGAWCTHLYRCFNEEQWGFLIGGALFFPVAIIHGLGIWFGAW